MTFRPPAPGFTPPRLLWWGVLVLFGLAGCSSRDETDRLRQLVDDAVALAHRHDMGGLMEHTARGFRAAPGNRGRAATAEALAGAFLHYGRFRVLHPLPVVELSHDSRSATMAMPLLIVRWNQPFPGLDDLRNDPSDWLYRVGEQADLYHLEIHLKKTGEDWQAVSARLQPFRGLSPAGR